MSNESVQKRKTALISGASIAGLTLAYWLNKYGYKVTVVEIASGLKKGGAGLDVRGDALHVADRMNLLDKISAQKITTAVEFVNADNQCIARMPNLGADSLNRDIEINRDDLVEIIYEAATANVEYLFGNRIITIRQDDNTVSVAFEDGQTRKFDFVFGADGVHSTVRKLIFGEERLFNHFFGAYFAILKVDNRLAKLNRGQLYNLPNKLMATSDNGNSFILFRSPKLHYDYKNDIAYKKILMDHFAGCGWKGPDILTHIAVIQIEIVDYQPGHFSEFPAGGLQIFSS